MAEWERVCDSPANMALPALPMPGLAGDRNVASLVHAISCSTCIAQNMSRGCVLAMGSPPVGQHSSVLFRWQKQRHVQTFTLHSHIEHSQLLTDASIRHCNIAEGSKRTSIFHGRVIDRRGFCILHVTVGCCRRSLCNCVLCRTPG